MRMIFGLVLMLGIGLAGFAVYMAKGYITEREAILAGERANQAQIVPTRDVFVTNRALRYGEPLTKEDVIWVAFPEAAIPEGAFLEPADLFPQDGLTPRAVLRTMEKGEVVLAVKVTEPGEDAGVSSRLSRGMRAFAIRVDVSTGVSGFLRPGDRVDVYWSGTVPDADGSRQEVTKLIEAGVKLVAIDQSADGDRSSPTVARTVTVEASPRQVAALAQAQSTGGLSLSLVGSEDDSIAEAIEIDQRQLLGLAPPEPEQRVVQAEAPRVCTIRTRRGGDMVEIAIPCSQ
ncbi:Flp pilus assembly protein CpaB [Profundibacterium mesophilum]|uniref:Components of type IV pilus n=1 Tax=Profundibacterium mesophilum KAUST100406-0324 TaxID=1037889 RepID=A0A921NUI8_9RHOB|nr:Flp pilus assembly protein CpaB [Profundibacterium mesophilum]KAF0675813.1 Components of type IV pilus [Profundibacterium mesophilum KAUST100406-0324]